MRQIFKPKLPPKPKKRPANIRKKGTTKKSKTAKVIDSVDIVSKMQVLMTLLNFQNDFFIEIPATEWKLKRRQTNWSIKGFGDLMRQHLKPFAGTCPILVDYHKVRMGPATYFSGKLMCVNPDCFQCNGCFMQREALKLVVQSASV